MTGEYDILGYQRGFCQQCGLSKCKKFDSGLQASILMGDILSCRKCGCSISAHKDLHDHGYISSSVASIVKRTMFQDFVINFKGTYTIFLLVFKRIWIGSLVIFSLREEKISTSDIRILESLLMNLGYNRF